MERECPEGMRTQPIFSFGLQPISAGPPPAPAAPLTCLPPGISNAF